MRSFFTTGTLLLFPAVALAGDVFEQLYGVPQGWTFARAAADEHKIRFTIAMSEPEEGLLEDVLYRVSDPAHQDYKQYFSRDELATLFRPHPEATSDVMEWLKSYISEKDISNEGEYIHFTANVGTAQKLLSAHFDVYQSEATHKETVRTLGYSIPERLHKHIDMIQPTTRFHHLHTAPFTPSHFKDIVTTLIEQAAQRNASGVPRACSNTPVENAADPACLKALYKVTNVPKVDPSIGFSATNNFLDQIPQYDQLALFLAKFAPYAKGSNFTFEGFNGSFNNQTKYDNSAEANLDMQYMVSMGYPVPVTAYSTAGLGPLVPNLDQPTQPGDNEPYLELLRALLAKNDSDLPHTLSTSYGEAEQTVPLRYRRTVCKMIGKLGARGVSVIFGSGDDGPGSACQSNDGKNTTMFTPNYPATCPYVTSVGGTFLIGPEQAVTFSSGGFSDTWERPRYQEAAVSSYLTKLGNIQKGLYNSRGRGYPDVAAYSVLQIYSGGFSEPIEGTSASAPTFGGIIALLNQLLLQNGKQPLGFLNPFLYSVGISGLTDITLGGSRGCSGTDLYSGLPTPNIPYAGWNATTGWDPVTGLGTPNFAKLRRLAMNATVS